MKGAGGGFGFDGVTEIGSCLEEAGCDDFLTKPIKKVELLATVAKYLRKNRFLFKDSKRERTYTHAKVPLVEILTISYEPIWLMDSKRERRWLESSPYSPRR